MTVEGGEDRRGKASATSAQVWALGGGLLLAGVLLIAALVEVLPAASTSEEEGERSVDLVFGLFTPSFGVDEALLVLIVVAGGLGAMVNTGTEFAYRVGDDRLDRRYLWWYPMRFVIAAATALILYFVLRGGLFDPTPDASADVNIYVFAGLAGLAGLFSTQAVRALGKIFGAIPGIETPYAEPAPRVSELVRGEDDPKGAPGEFVLRGHGFTEGSEVMIEDQPASAQLIDDTRIGVRLDPSKHRPGSRLQVAVRGPADSEGEHTDSEPTTLVVPGGEHTEA